MKTLPIFTLVCVLLVSCQTPPPATLSPAKESLLDLVENQNLDKIRDIFGLNTDINSINATGQTALHIAAIKDLADIAAVLLARGAEVDLQDAQGNTALNLAVKNGSVGILPVLIQYNASLFVSDKQGKSPLQTALQQNPEIIPKLITQANVGRQDAAGNTVLHLAASQGLENLADILLKLGAGTGTRNLQGLSPLDEALQFAQSLPHSKIAWKLTRQGSPAPNDKNVDYFWRAAQADNANMTFEQGTSALHLAAARGHTGLLKMLTTQGASVQATDLPGNTPLHSAVEAGNIDAAAWLIDKGADVNAKDFNNNTTLHLALTSRNPTEMVTFLLSKAALPNSKNNFGNTPLHLVVALNLPASMASLLISHGADVNARNKVGNSALLESVKEKKQELVQGLLISGANPFAVNNSDESPLSVAIQQGGDTLSWLVNSSNTAQRDDNGDSALHLAVKLKKYPAAVQYLLSIGANPNERNKAGLSPLHMALSDQNLLISQTLLKEGADLYLLNNSGKSPLNLAFQSPVPFVDAFFQPEILELRDSAKNTPLFHSVFTGNIPILQILLKKGASLGVQNLGGSTVLHEAVRLGNVEAAGLLLKAGSSLTSTDNLGNTPLHNLVFWDSQDMGDLLLNSGAAINAKNKDGRTTLQEAVRRGETKLVSYLLKKKADPNARDSLGRSPLFDAVQISSQELVQLLISQGGSVNIRDASGSTILHQAAIAAPKGIIDLLISNNGDLFAENASGITPAVIALKGNPETWKNFFNPKNVNLQNNQGSTAVHLAAASGVSPLAVQYIMGIGADLEIRNKDGKTAADVAKAFGRTDLLNLFSPPKP